MPVASSQYWNSVHGREAGQAAQDEEGLQTMRVLAHNMAFLMKSIALGKEQFGLPGQRAACVHALHPLAVTENGIIRKKKHSVPRQIHCVFSCADFDQLQLFQQIQIILQQMTAWHAALCFCTRDDAFPAHPAVDPVYAEHFAQLLL